jgi:hypothetical protein
MRASFFKTVVTDQILACAFCLSLWLFFGYENERVLFLRIMRRSSLFSRVLVFFFTNVFISVKLHFTSADRDSLIVSEKFTLIHELSWTFMFSITLFIYWLWQVNTSRYQRNNPDIGYITLVYSCARDSDDYIRLCIYQTSFFTLIYTRIHLSQAIKWEASFSWSVSLSSFVYALSKFASSCYC